VLGYNNIQTDGQATGTGVDAHGNDHELNLYQRASIYELRDQGRAMFASNGGEITTHDAHGAARDMTAPTDQNIVTDDDTSFIGNPFSINGSVDAHWLAGQTYEYFRSLGRNSLDNNGMDIVSLIDAADSEGGPLFNASWNGTYVTYGNPDSSQLYPFSAAADVVAHELTHGVTDFSAGLISLGQSGAMNEAYSDYFGNALDVNLSGQPMDEPGVGFIGEDLCKVPDPDNFSCPVRNLNTTRAVEDYIYFLADFDNGGVHINSPIYGAALWDIREQLGGPAADLLVYKALTEFTTPLATFTDGRNAVLAAADALGYSGAQKQAVDAAFDERGIVAGWDSADGSDALTLIPNHTPLGFEISPPRVSGARFITGHYADLLGLCCAPEEIYVGRVDGTGDLNKVGQDDEPGTLNDELPDLSGKRAVWAHLKDSASGPDFNVSTRVLGGRAKSVAKGDGWQWHPAVDDDLVAWEDTNHESTDIWARRIGKRAMRVTRSPGDELRPDVSGDWIAYWDPPEGKGLYRVRVENVKTGKTTSYSAGDTAFLSPPSVSNKYVYWYQDQNFIDSQDPRGSIMKARLGSEVAKTLFPSSAAGPRIGGTSPHCP
jgi:Thermolysin metallopeptidase, catalytic domain/Thermolysin metallopeptidase, alpha-helical domain